MKIFAIFETQNNNLLDRGYLVLENDIKYNFHKNNPDSKVIEIFNNIDDINKYYAIRDNNDNIELKLKDEYTETNLILKAKEIKIKELKNITKNKIQTIGDKFYNDTEWLKKSQNFQDTINEYLDYRQKQILGIDININSQKAHDLENERLEAKYYIDRKNKFRKIHNEIENEILNLNNLEEVSNYIIDKTKYIY